MAASPTPDERANDLGRRLSAILPSDYDAEFGVLVLDGNAMVSLYVPSELAERAEEIAADEGFVVGNTYDVDEFERFYAFDYESDAEGR